MSDEWVIHIHEPNYLCVEAVFEFVFNCLVSFATGLYNFAAILLQAGINLVCG